MERGRKQVSLSPASSAIYMSRGIDIERGDPTLVVDDLESHSGQAGWERDHHALANKLVSEFLLIRLNLRRVGIESALGLHGHESSLTPTFGWEGVRFSFYDRPAGKP
jgi:hypothetical protein